MFWPYTVFPRGTKKSLIVLMPLTGMIWIFVHLYAGKGVHLPVDFAALQKRSDGHAIGLHDLNMSRHAVHVDHKAHFLFRSLFSQSPDTPFPMGPDKQTQKDNYFIYRCDEDTLSGCGGWLDRLQGAMAAYLIANLTGRTFKLEIVMGSCDFHRYTVPNKVDWHLPVSFHEKVTKSSDTSIINNMDATSFMANVDFNFSTMPAMASKFVYYKGNREYFWRFQRLRKYQTELAWMQNLTYADIGNALYRRLFKPSAILQNSVKSFLTRHLLPHEKLVCAHMRTGKNPTIPRDSTYMRISETGIRNVITFLHNLTQYNDSKIFFMSDNAGLIRRMKNLSFGGKFFFSPGRIIHIGKSDGIPDDQKCEGLEKIIFEHNVLFHCDVILISKSAIGLYAAFVRNTDQGLFCLNPKGFVGPCKRNKIMDILGLEAL